jgi:hypothetical protein
VFRGIVCRSASLELLHFLQQDRPHLRFLVGRERQTALRTKYDDGAQSRRAKLKMVRELKDIQSAADTAEADPDEGADRRDEKDPAGAARSAEARRRAVTNPDKSRRHARRTRGAMVKSAPLVTVWVAGHWTHVTQKVGIRIRPPASKPRDQYLADRESRNAPRTLHLAVLILQSCAPRGLSHAQSLSYRAAFVA